eukprot:gene31176-biopygen20010
MGYADDDGYMFITDRVSDMIVSGGVNIYPAEAELVLIRHPGVADVAVIAAPNAEMGAMGWAGVIVPEEHDGTAFGYLSLGLILEETGRTLVASPLLSTALIGASALTPAADAGGEGMQTANLFAAYVNENHPVLDQTITRNALRGRAPSKTLPRSPEVLPIFSAARRARR